MNVCENLNDVLLDEIALEGLDGITLEGLWNRLSDRLKLPLPFTEKIKTRFWEIARRLKPVSIYELPESRPFFIFDRYSHVEADLGVAIDPDEIPLNIYPYYPVKDNYIQGSCKHFETRTDKTDEVRKLRVEEVEGRYPNKIVLVASQEVRYNTLVPNNYQLTFTPLQYCILERIGRSRYAGEVTIGKVSLQDIGESAKSLFYHRKTLLQFKLITKQPYHHKMGTSNHCGCLLHLPRFYIERKPKGLLVIEEVVETLRTKPNCIASYDEIRNCFSDALRFKRIWKTAEFQRLIRTDVKILYKDLHPESDKKLWVTKNGEDKVVRCFQLIDPNVDLNEVWTKEEVEDDDVEHGLLNNKETPIDMPLMMYALKIITDSGHKGITQNELSVQMGQNRLNARAICRNLVRKRCIVFFMDNIGRQRVTKFMSKHFIKYSQIQKVFSEHNLLEANKQATIMENQITEESNINLKRKVDEIVSEDSPPNKNARLETNVKNEALDKSSSSDIQQPQSINLNEDLKLVMTDANNIVTTIELTTEVPGMKMFNANALEHGKTWGGKTDQQCGAMVTFRFLRRMNLLIKFVKEKKVIHDLTKLMKQINEAEEKEGDLTKIDKKTLYRLMLKVQQEGHIKLYKVTLQSSVVTKTLCFVCEPHTPPDHELIRSEIERSKMKLCVSRQPFAQTRSDSDNYLDFGLETSVTAIQAQHAHMKSIYRKSAGKDYGYKPRFMRLRLTHQLLYYLIYELKPDAPVYSKYDLIEEWQNKNIDISDELIEELPEQLYSTDVCWKMFIPPMPQLKEWTSGWAIVCDIIYRMPLNIFVKVVCIPYDIPELHEILKHPVKKFLLLKQLPEYLRSCLVFKRRYIFSIYHGLLQLCFMGILQFGPQRLKEKDQMYVYLNRRAVVLDTRTSDRGYNQTTEKEYPIQRFEFDSYDDIEKYWYELWNICVHTFLGLRSNLSSTEETVIVEFAESKPALLKFTEPKQNEEAPDFDVGYIPGDNRGAGGLDSSLYAHFRRNWNWSNAATKNRSKPIDQSGNETAVVKRKRLNFKDLSAKRGSNRKKIIKVKKCIDLKTPSSTTPAPKAVRCKIRSLNKKVPSKKKPVYDEIDREALKLMNKLRVDWTEEEDRVLLLCKVGYLYLSPKNKKHIIVFQHVRDIIHRLLNSRNKTAVSCQRRINYMLKNNITQNDVALVLEELNQCTEITNTFKNVPKEKLNIAFVVLVGILLRKSVQKTRNRSRVVIPDTIEELNEKFHFYTPKPIKADFIYNHPDTIQDIHASILQSTVHSTMCYSADKTSWNFQIFKVYQEYPETLVRSVMTNMRHHQLISIKKNIMTKKISKFPLVNCPYQLSQMYKNKLITRPPYNIFSDSYRKLTEMYEKLTSTTNNDKFEVIAMTGGSAAAIFELCISCNLDFSVKIPDQVIILDPSIKSRAGLKYNRIETIDVLNTAPLSLTDSGDLEDEGEMIFPDKIVDIPSTSSTPMYPRKSRFLIHKMREEITEKLEDLPDNTQHMHDFFVVNSSLVYIHKNTNANSSLPDFQQIDSEKSRKLISSIQRSAVVSLDKADCSIIPKRLKEVGGNYADIDFCNQLISFIYEMKYFGITGKRLEDNFSSYNGSFTLPEMLNMLVDWKILFRCGIADVTYVHYNYINAWIIKSFKLKRLEREKLPKNLQCISDENNIPEQCCSNQMTNNVDGKEDNPDDTKVMREKLDKSKFSLTKTKKTLVNSFEEISVNIAPWIRIDGTLNRRILDRWLGAVLTYCIDTPGVSVSRVAQRFSFLRPFEVKLLLEYLEYLECLKIEKIVKNKTVSLFDHRTEITIVPANGLESFDEIFVETLPLCVTKLGVFIGKKQYKTDFLTEPYF